MEVIRNNNDSKWWRTMITLKFPWWTIMNQTTSLTPKHYKEQYQIIKNRIWRASLFPILFKDKLETIKIMILFKFIWIIKNWKMNVISDKFWKSEEKSLIQKLKSKFNGFGREIIQRSDLLTKNILNRNNKDLGPEIHQKEYYHQTKTAQNWFMAQKPKNGLVWIP